MRKLIFFLWLISVSFVWGDDEAFKKSRMIGELETIKNIFDIQYAPKAWKKEYFNWDLATEIEKAKQQVISTENITAKDFQFIVRKFFNSTHDYHVKVFFISTESAFLPLEIKGTNEKYFVTHVNHSLLSSRQYPIHQGDEIILFEGRPIKDVVAELQMKEFGTEGPGTDRSFTELMLTHRSGTVGQEVPRGPISIQVRHQGNSALRTYQLIWTYTPEKINNHFNPMLTSHESKLESDGKKINKIKPFDKPWITPYYKPFENKILHQIVDEFNEEDHDETEGDPNPFALGAKNSFIPKLGRVWWVNEKKWSAYIFETANYQLVGYLRIPHYNDLLGSSFEELKNIIHLFEDRTDALVIDQINNPGGIAFFMYAIASLLTDHALQTPRHRMVITHEDVYNAVSTISSLEYIDSDQAAEKVFGSDLCGYPVSYQFAQHWLEFCRFISEQWNAGKKFTDPYHLYGIDHINPNPHVRYTKPILLLINELDFSCADFLPAIMQDNKRATIMGTQTSGAGGYVLTNILKSRYGIAGFRITGSIAQRNNKQPIENLGVTPDIHYALTEADYRNHFQGYKKAILEALNTLLAK